MMQIKKNLLIISVLFFTLSLNELEALNYAYWHHFKDRFIEQSGRVVDRMNNDISHSEGMSYGMFFAVTYGDKNTFDKIFNWGETNFPKNNDNLYSWKWGKGTNGWGVLDKNNATDGDMWIAYSLLLAYEKWNDINYLNKAKEIIYNIKEGTLITINNKTFLLPGSYGFFKPNHFKINPSYYILFIFDKFAIYDHDPIWHKVIKDSIEMFQKSALGQLGIHPDWIRVTNPELNYEVIPLESKYSYDAIRTPLFLAYYYKLTKNPEVYNLLSGYKTLMAYINRTGRIIYQIDLLNEKILFKNPAVGYYAVYDYLFYTFGIKSPRQFKSKIEKGIMHEKKDYYSFSLILFSDIFK
jgi:endoglucanase